MFSETLNRILSSQNISQARLQSGCGIAQETLSRYISGVRIPGYNDILAISNSLNVSPAVFFPGAKEKKVGFTEYKPVLCPFPCGVAYSVLSDDINKVSIVNITYSKDINHSPLCPMLKVSEEGVTNVIIVNEGEMEFGYEFNRRKLVTHQAFALKGFERTFSVKSGTRISIVVSGLSYDKVRDGILQLIKNGECSCRI